MDDFFLSTYFDSQAPGPGGKTQYRATLADVQAHASWQSELTARLPAGSDVRLDLPLNGNGVVAAAASGSNGMVPLVVDDRSCQRMPEYTQYNCACWLTGSAACPRTQERWCWNCTKARFKSMRVQHARMHVRLRALPLRMHVHHATQAAASLLPPRIPTNQPLQSHQLPVGLG